MPPSMEEQFEIAYQLLRNEDLQNARLPAGLREIVQNAPSVDQTEPAFGQFGTSLTNAVPVNGAVGEILYLSSIRHSSGLPIVFHRLGSFGRTDIFETATIDGRHWDVFYLNMYFVRKSHFCPSGYSIESKNIYAKGTTVYLPKFPLGLIEAVTNWSRGYFGVAATDPALKAVEADASSFSRPSRHAGFIRTLEIHGRLSKSPDLGDRFTGVVWDVAREIERALGELHKSLSELPDPIVSNSCNRNEIVMFSLSCVIDLIFRVFDTTDPAGLADRVTAKVLREQSDIGLEEFRNRFYAYRERLTQMLTRPAAGEKQDRADAFYTNARPLLERALVNMVGNADELSITVFAGYLTILLSHAKESIISQASA